MFSWRGGETVTKDEQVNLQEQMEISTPNVQLAIEEGIYIIYGLDISDFKYLLSLTFLLGCGVLLIDKDRIYFYASNLILCLRC